MVQSARTATQIDAKTTAAACRLNSPDQQPRVPFSRSLSALALSSLPTATVHS